MTLPTRAGEDSPEQPHVLLYDFLDRLSHEAELDEVLQQTAETILRLHCEHPVEVSIACMDGETWEWHADGRRVEGDRTAARAWLRPHIEQIYRTGEPQSIPAQPPQDRCSAPVGDGSALAVPIKFAGQLLGVLSVACERPHAFGRREVEFVGAVAHILAAALLRVRERGSPPPLKQYRHMAEELSERQRKLDKLLELLPVGISILDAERNIVYRNPALSEILGLSQHDLSSGQYIYRRYLAADGSPMAPDDYASVRAARSGEAVYDVETGIAKEDGEIIWTTVSAVPVDFSDWKTIIATSDITQRKRAEQMLRQWADAFEHCAHGIALGDPATNRIRTCNPAFANLQRRTIQALTGMPILGLYSPDEHARVKSLMQEADRTGSVRFEANMIRGDGTAYPVQMDVISVRDEAGKLLYRVVTQQDITERKRSEEELRRSNFELEQFAYVASHDMQEPLRGIAGMLQLLQTRYQDSLDEQGNEYILHAVDAAQRMQEMIRALLTYSRAGRADLPMKVTDLGQLLRTVLANLELSIRESGAVITHDELPVVTADPLQITQLLQNLIANGIKFRGERTPRLHVGVSRQNDAYIFSVRDNGIGIESRYYERIFLLFQRLHARSAYPGTGIGLTLCKKIVERHGGSIWVESRAGEGTVFYFSLPTQSPSEPA